MTRIERIKLKKKAKRQFWTAFGLIMFVVLFLVTLFTTPLIDIVRSIGSDPLDNFKIALKVIVLFFIIAVPIYMALYFNSAGGWNLEELGKEKRRLYEQRNKLHMKFFWDAIRAKDYEEAKRLYNLDKFIWGSERVLCNGILMGIATLEPIDKDWSENVNNRMNSYLV